MYHVFISGLYYTESEGVKHSHACTEVGGGQMKIYCSLEQQQQQQKIRFLIFFSFCKLFETFALRMGGRGKTLYILQCMSPNSTFNVTFTLIPI